MATQLQLERLDKWVAALRSGEYRQGHQRLKVIVSEHDERYCCLGVACELYRQENPDTSGWTSDTVMGRQYARFEVDYAKGSTGTLPEPVRDYFGLTDDAGYYVIPETDGLKTNLINMNDWERASFNVIAGVIERKPEGLLVT